MKKIIMLCVGILPLLNSYAWFGDTDKYEFAFDTINLQAFRESSTATIFQDFTTPSDACWSFDFMCDYTVSSSNYVKIWLMSSDSTFTGEGYFLRIGYTDKNVSLYRKDESGQKKLGSVGSIVAGQRYSIKVTRSAIGDWNVNLDSLNFKISDDTYFTSAYAGISVIYTSTRCNSFHFYNVMFTGNEPFNEDEGDDLQSIEKEDAKDVVSVVPDPFVVSEGSAAVSFCLTECASVRLYVYSAAGYLVRKLIDGKNIEGSATIAWDGLFDNGMRAPVGIYIVVYEAFNQNKYIVRSKKVFVVAERR